MRALAVTLLLASATLGAAAEESANAPESLLADPAAEARAREVSRTLRCLVCQNQSIEDSNAELARDLRRIVRERVAAGDSDDAVRGYLVARYGDWVLLKPPLKGETLLLWAGPALLLAAGGVAIAVYFRRRRAEVPVVQKPLDKAEQARLDALLGGDGRS